MGGEKDEVSRGQTRVAASPGVRGEARAGMRFGSKSEGWGEK